jgi:uncharacterized protein (TIGR02453 family)
VSLRPARGRTAHTAAMPTTARSEGFRPEAIQFLADLAEHNDRAWFQAHKSEYERLIKEPFERLVEDLAGRFAARRLPLDADPRRSIFRIYRDTRFSKDKSPYKTHQSARFTWAAEDSALTDHAHGAGGYFHFEPGAMYLGGGMYQPDRPMLDAWRRLVVERSGDVHRAIEDPRFVAAFGGVSTRDPFVRVPAGYPRDYPDADLLRMRDVIFGRPLADAEVLSPTLPDTIADGFAAAMPVLSLLASLRP